MYHHRLYWTTISLLVWHLSSTQPGIRVKGIPNTAAATNDPDTAAALESAVKDPDKQLMSAAESQTKTHRAATSAHMYQQSSAACQPFVVGDPQKPNIIYSPGYPNNYPNNTDCVRILEADYNKVLRLDFRDSFNIEPSEECKFDFLEIRDGAHGFSNPLGQFCGHEFPPIITSKDRYLWLHFHSDDNIEYSGFTAVYESIEKPSSSISKQLECVIEMSDDQGFINNTDVADKVLMAQDYGIPLDCMWIITVAEGWKIQLEFRIFKLDRPNDCESNFIDVFDGRTDIPSRKKNFCGSVAGE